MKNKWKIIRNDEGEIIRYQLTENIYIEREYSKDFKSNRYYKSLIVNGKLKGIVAPGSGITLNDLKRIGEIYL